MSQLIRLAVILMLVSIAGFSLYAFHESTASKEWNIETTSPAGNYLVKLRGKTDLPSRSYYSHGTDKVEFTVFKNGKPVIMNEPLYSGDEYDDLFLDLYPAYEWVSESTIRLGQEAKTGQFQSDELTVLNNTNKSFEYLRVDAGVSEKFIILDLTPGMKVQLHAYPQTDQQSDISGFVCYAKSNGTPIEKSAGFDIRGKYRSSAHYYIEIGDLGIDIKSADFKQTK